jgi:hypothetical protein
VTATVPLPRIVTIVVEMNDGRSVVALAPFHHFDPDGHPVYRGMLAADLAAQSTRTTVEGMPPRGELHLIVEAT